MRIGIAGYGRMGQIIHRTALAAGHEVPLIIDPASMDKMVNAKKAEPGMPAVDVIIDFTSPRAVIANIKLYGELKIPAVIGTTGWYDEMGQVISVVENTGIGLIWSGNFSLGVNIFFYMVKAAGNIMNRFTGYDVAIDEYHHRYKADSPSGTAAMLGEILLNSLDRKKNIFPGSPEEVIAEDQLNISSTRCGSVPGTHRIIFDSEVDTIILEHAARSREGFALGAVKAAEWICGRSGLYSIDNMMESILGGE